VLSPERELRLERELSRGYHRALLQHEGNAIVLNIWRSARGLVGLAAVGSVLMMLASRYVVQRTSGQGTQIALPEFPWPPPPPSAKKIIPVLTGISRASLRNFDNFRLSDVDRLLRISLQNAGYEHAYYRVPNGFAVVARFERMADDGSPYIPDSLRFDATFQPSRRSRFSMFSLGKCLEMLHYRVIVFIVSPDVFTTTGKPISSNMAIDWSFAGGSGLPRRVGDLYYSDNYRCTMLIYEFEKRDVGDGTTKPIQLRPGRLSADAHLAKSGIASGLGLQMSRP
jgi:hypothetical protein